MKLLPEHGSCFICGSENPHNVGLRWYVNERGVVSSEFTLTLAQQGPPGNAHGGLSSAVLDEVMGAAVWHAGYTAAAARLVINFHKPVPLGIKLATKGYLIRRNGRKIYTRGEINLPDGTLAVSGRGIYIEAPHLFARSKMFKE